MMAYRWLPHTADLRAEIAAATLRETLEEAGAAVRELLAGQSEVASRETQAISVSGTDESELLLAFLRALFALYHEGRFLPSRVELANVTSANGAFNVSGTVHGEPFDATRHEAQPEVKAVTRHGLNVRRAGDGWVAEVVFDV
jgi:SHS2 domain-containing protein